MQGSKLYVGNLTYSVTSEQLKELFAKYGEVVKADVIQGKGFGFVEMANPEAAEKAKQGLNDTEFEGRAMRVDEARPPKSREERGYGSPGGGYGSPRGGYGSGGRGGYGSKRGGYDSRRGDHGPRRGEQRGGNRDRGY